MSPHRRKRAAEAEAALRSADQDLRRARARWGLIHALTGKAEKVSDEAHRQRQINHLGDLFQRALREG